MGYVKVNHSQPPIIKYATVADLLRYLPMISTSQYDYKSMKVECNWKRRPQTQCAKPTFAAEFAPLHINSSITS
jgi:hypothetical protein